MEGARGVRKGRKTGREGKNEKKSRSGSNWHAILLELSVAISWAFRVRLPYIPVVFCGGTLGDGAMVELSAKERHRNATPVEL